MHCNVCGNIELWVTHNCPGPQYIFTLDIPSMKTDKHGWRRINPHTNRWLSCDHPWHLFTEEEKRNALNNIIREQNRLNAIHEKEEDERIERVNAMQDDEIEAGKKRHESNMHWSLFTMGQQMKKEEEDE